MTYGHDLDETNELPHKRCSKCGVFVPQWMWTWSSGMYPICRWHQFSNPVKPKKGATT